MIIRDAVFEDLEQVMPILHDIHKASIFAAFPMNEAYIQRTFVVTMQFGKGFVKVVEDKGKIIGCMAAVITENHFGIRVAKDLFTYSEGGTGKLLKEFKAWAKENDAQITQISDFCGRERYHKLITDMGFMPVGINFVGV